MFPVDSELAPIVSVSVPAAHVAFVTEYVNAPVVATMSVGLAPGAELQVVGSWAKADTDKIVNASKKVMHLLNVI
jgi:hypothetical protein